MLNKPGSFHSSFVRYVPEVSNTFTKLLLQNQNLLLLMC